MRSTIRNRPPLSAVCALLLGGALAAGLHAQATERFDFDGRSLALGNLIGAIDVERASGPRFEVEVAVRGRDARPDSIRFERHDGARASLDVVFPVQSERRYVYPELGRGSANIRLHANGDRGWLRELIDAVASPEIRVSGSGAGTELWADVTVRVPTGGRLEVKHGVGKVFARDVDGELRVDVKSGGVDGEALRGAVTLSTGSGAVTLDDVDGELLVDTGSGAVKVTGVRGPRVGIDTGSGRVVLEDVETGALWVDTGSGSVSAERVRAESATVDTGSGSVVLALTEMGSGEFEIDTGSGSITLLMPSEASAEVQADTGSGGIQVDLPSVQTLYRERDEMRFRVGAGGAQVRLDTGSGAIKVGPSDR
jgi:lia operon protein LiaG